MRRFPGIVTLALLGLLAGPLPASAGDQPAGPKGDGPKVEGKDAPPKKDAPPGDAKPSDDARPATPAPTLDQVLADLADTKFTVKRLDAATAAKQFQDPRLTPLLAKLLKDEYPDVRTAAVAALAARTDPDQRKKAADALGSRLDAISGKPELDAERGQVIDALHDLAQPSTIDTLIDKIDYGTSLDEVDARCRAVANVPSPRAIEALIGFMQKRHRDGTGYRSACNKALQYATGERGANDADMWRAWWKEHEKTFDFQAAFDARRKAEHAKEEAADRREKAREKAKERQRDKEKKDGGSN
jgi:HEAT repeat protein